MSRELISRTLVHAAWWCLSERVLTAFCNQFSSIAAAGGISTVHTGVLGISTVLRVCLEFQV